MSKNPVNILRNSRTLFWYLDRSNQLPGLYPAFQVLSQNTYHSSSCNTKLILSPNPIPFNGRNLHKSYLNEAQKYKTDCEEPEPKPGLFQRFKQMYRDYWYVLVPVHLVTSAAWFGGFYYCAKSGVDIVSLAESLHLSESFVNKLKSGGNSTAGYLAISYGLYKIFTPLRYTVTLGGTTLSINYLTNRGYIKPIPRKAELQKMLQDRRDNFREKSDAMKLNIIEKKDAMKSNIMEKFTQKKR